MNRAFPGALRESDILYQYEPDSPYPYAIDLYARHLSPILALQPQARGAFATDYLTEAAQIHEQLFGKVPRAYGSVGLALSDETSLLHVMSLRGRPTARPGLRLRRRCRGDGGGGRARHARQPASTRRHAPYTRVQLRCEVAERAS